MLLLTKSAFVVLLVLATRDSQTAAAPFGDTPEEDGDVGNLRSKRDTIAMFDFLSKYGYVPKDLDDDQLASEETITIAIKEFQKFSGLKVSGILDRATANKMKAPRCGLPDILHSDDSPQNTPLAYTTMGTRWSKNTLTWMPTKLSNKLRENDQLSAIQKAFDVWAEVTPLIFQQTKYEPDIEIKFAPREHGDGEGNKFDGRGGVLAHAFGPGANLGGDAHFDDDEAWTIGNDQGTDLVQVAAHEFGHALGLAHSSVPGALMAPYYIYSDKVTLKSDDIQGIQAIYGPNVRRPIPKVSTTLATLPTTKSTVTAATTVKSTTTRRNTNGPIPSYCRDNFQLDAIFQDQREHLYAFRGDLVYKFNRQGMELGYPKLITQVFPKAPKMSISAVTFVPETGKTYIFKGPKVWRYTNFSLDSSYPKIWTNDRKNIPSATLTLTHMGRSQIFMFGDNYFWEWNHYTEKVSGYPLAIQAYFPYSPNSPDAALLNQQGHFFFFKGNSYKKLENRGRDSNFKPLSQNLFGSVCGGHPEILNLISPRSFNDQELRGLSDVLLPQPEFSPMVWRLIRRQ